MFNKIKKFTTEFKSECVRGINLFKIGADAGDKATVIGSSVLYVGGSVLCALSSTKVIAMAGGVAVGMGAVGMMNGFLSGASKGALVEQIRIDTSNLVNLESGK